VARLAVGVDVEAAASDVWAALVDWNTHHTWMLATRASADGAGAGAEVVATTGIGRLSFRDTMTVTQWEPPPADPARCVVAHTGTVVRGSGAFAVFSRGPGRCRIVWSEWIRPPLGLLGEVGWLGVRPLAAAFLTTSLRRLARRVEAAARDE
jgi:hypothetical protein